MLKCGKTFRSVSTPRSMFFLFVSTKHFYLYSTKLHTLLYTGTNIRRTCSLFLMDKVDNVGQQDPGSIGNVTVLLADYFYSRECLCTSDRLMMILDNKKRHFFLSWQLRRKSKIYHTSKKRCQCMYFLPVYPHQFHKKST